MSVFINLHKKGERTEKRKPSCVQLLRSQDSSWGAVHGGASVGHPVDGHRGQPGTVLCLGGGLCGGAVCPSVASVLSAGRGPDPCGSQRCRGNKWGPWSIFSCRLVFWYCHSCVWDRPGLRSGELGENRCRWGLCGTCGRVQALGEKPRPRGEWALQGWCSGWDCGLRARCPRVAVGAAAVLMSMEPAEHWGGGGTGRWKHEPAELASFLTGSCTRVRCKQAISAWQAISSTPWWLC